MTYPHFDHRPSLREARLLRNHDMPGESFRGQEGNFPGIPEQRLNSNFRHNQNFNNRQNFNEFMDNRGMPPNFQNRPNFHNPNFQNTGHVHNPNFHGGMHHMNNPNFHPGTNFNSHPNFHRGSGFNRNFNHQNHQFHRNFHNREFSNHHFHNQHNFNHFNVQHQNEWHNAGTFCYWKVQNPSWWCWEYKEPVRTIVERPVAKTVEVFRMGALQSMRGMERYRNGALRHANEGLDPDMRLPEEYASNRELGRFGGRMGAFNIDDYEKQYGYPALTGGPSAQRQNPFDRTWDRYRDQVERHWSRPRHDGMHQLRDRWAGTGDAPYVRSQIDTANNQLANWGGMSPRQQGRAYNDAMNAARPHFDTRGIRQNFLDSVNQFPGQWGGRHPGQGYGPGMSMRG